MTPKQPRADEYPTDWQSQLKILISAWVHRLVKFGQCKASKEGWTVFECPELEPFIEDLLAARDQEWQDKLERVRIWLHGWGEDNREVDKFIDTLVGKEGE
jgi:hypothetical protein